MIFAIPATIVAGKAIAGTVAAIIAAITGKKLYDYGRRKGQAEARDALAADIQALHCRMDEMEYGG